MIKRAAKQGMRKKRHQMVFSVVERILDQSRHDTADVVKTVCKAEEGRLQLLWAGRGHEEELVPDDKQI